MSMSEFWKITLQFKVFNLTATCYKTLNVKEVPLTGSRYNSPMKKLVLQVVHMSWPSLLFFWGGGIRMK